MSGATASPAFASLARVVVRPVSSRTYIRDTRGAGDVFAVSDILVPGAASVPGVPAAGLIPADVPGGGVLGGGVDGGAMAGGGVDGGAVAWGTGVCGTDAVSFSAYSDWNATYRPSSATRG